MLCPRPNCGQGLFPEDDGRRVQCPRMIGGCGVSEIPVLYPAHYAHTHTYMYTHSSRSVADATQPIMKVLVSKQLSSQPSKSSRHNQTLKGHKSPDGLKPMRDIFRTMPILSLARDVELQLRRTVGLNNAFPYVNSWGEYTCASEKVGNRVKRSSINC